MAQRYTCEVHAIQLAMEKLKKDNLVAQDATFNPDAPDGLRKEVTYRDFDFLTRLSRVGEKETIASVRSWMIQKGVVTTDSGYDPDAFASYSKEVRENFSIPGTSISPLMEAAYPGIIIFL